MPGFTVVVVTHNRAAVLRDTLAALGRLSYSGSWDVLVVDNNSEDATKRTVEETARQFPVPLRYLFVGTPGKYYALNAGVEAADSSYIAATDDDAFPEPDWLDRAAEGFRTYGCDFVGGPVFPVWRGAPPRWLNARSATTGKVLGLQDYGGSAVEYGRNGISWPLGVNVAYRRDAFERAGSFDARLGRVAGTLRNQSQREWHLRARTAGLTGMYLPAMKVHHCVEAERLTRSYFRRWFYWHGISRAILYQTKGLHLIEPESERSHDGERHVLNVPVSVWREAGRAAASAGKRWLLGRADDALHYELLLCFCAGVLRQRLRDRRTPLPHEALAPR